MKLMLRHKLSRTKKEDEEGIKFLIKNNKEILPDVPNDIGTK